jgi:hypothetical protein
MNSHMVDLYGGLASGRVKGADPLHPRTLTVAMKISSALKTSNLDSGLSLI